MTVFRTRPTASPARVASPTASSPALLPSVLPPPNPSSASALPPDFLIRSHRAFHDVEQAPLPADQVLEAAGHPRAAAYRYCRRVFDLLPFAAHAGTRFVAVRHPDAYVELGAPHLTLSVAPGRFHALGEVRPSDTAGWLDYCALAAESGFPPDTAPAVHCGTWYIPTDDAAQVLALRGLGGRFRAGMVRVPCATLEAWRQVATWVEAHFGDCFVAGASSVPQPTAVPAAAPCASRLVASHEVATVPSWHRLDGVEIRTPERAIPVFDACRQHVPARPTADPHAAARIAVDGLLTWLEGGVPWLSLAPLLRRFVSPATYAGLHAWHAADAIDPSSVR